MLAMGHVLPTASRALAFLRGQVLRYTEFAIGIMEGPSPLSLSAPAGLNPVLSRKSVTGVHAAFVADPFMLEEEDGWHMFFEVLTVRGRARRGEIGHATSRDGRRWRYEGIVLAEPFHLSYPYVFRDGDRHYLVPETRLARAVRLYRADPFPTRWVFEATLLTGPILLDSSLFRHGGRWWMFTHTAVRDPTLRLFHADAITGPWIEHPKSPIVAGDARIARPAGRVLTLPDRIIRFAQDCSDEYGLSVRALEIERLTTEDYREVAAPAEPLLAGSGRGWNASGMHHVDAHQRKDGTWIACVDGWTSRLWKP